MDNQRVYECYLAGPIFFEGDLYRTQHWVKKLNEEFGETLNIYAPLLNTEINGIEGKKRFADARMIADADNKRLDKSDILIACIDGDVLPSGTCAEIGKFHEKIARGDKKHIVGICTDNRQCYLTHSKEKDEGGSASSGNQQYSYQNIYVTGLIKEYGELYFTIDEVIEDIKKWIASQETPKVMKGQISFSEKAAHKISEYNF